VHEKTKLCDILRPYLEVTEDENFAQKVKRRKLLGDDDVEGEESDDPFAIYKSKGFSKTKLLLKAEGIHKKQRRFFFFFFFLLLGCVCVLSFCLTFVIVLLFFFFINCLRFLSFPFSFSLISPPQHVFRRKN
jgi:hypothetical protein